MTVRPPGIQCSGTARVVQFNWPKYACATAILAVAAATSAFRIATPARGLIWATAVPAAVWAMTSLSATWWVYDHRRVYERLTAGLADPGQWAAVHAGFDDSYRWLCESIGRPPAAVGRIALRPGPSLRRARKLTGQPGSSSVDLGMLRTAGVDCVFLTFAAHEVRDLAAQRALFRELHRALRAGGRLVITEHLRDIANFAVYGPGALHFQPKATWLARASEAGLTLEGDTQITPFVHRLVWRR